MHDADVSFFNVVYLVFLSFIPPFFASETKKSSLHIKIQQVVRWYLMNELKIDARQQINMKRINYVMLFADSSQ